MTETASDSNAILSQLARVIEARRQAAPESSYVASLNARGLDAILKKVGEEAAETLIAGKGGDREQLVHEVADLWFHTIVLLAHYEVGPEAVSAELARRFGISGLAEKAARRKGAD